MSETELSPIQLVSNEILLRIFEYLDIRSLCNVPFVCHAWNYLSTDSHLWRNKIAEPKEFNHYTDQILAMNYQWKRLYFELLRLNSKYFQYPLLSDVVRASSADHEDQDLDKTLVPLDIRTHDMFWSSKGSADPNSGEWAIYKLRQPLCAVSSVHILPYRASFQQGSPVYGSQSVQISVGYTPNAMHWNSAIFPVENKPVVQVIKLEPYLAVGGYLRIDYYGRCTTQSQDELYYTVIEHITAIGAPVGCIDNELVSNSLVHYATHQEKFRQEMKQTSNDSHIQDLLKQSMDQNDILAIAISTQLSREMTVYLGEETERVKGMAKVREFMDRELTPQAITLVLENEALRNRDVFALFIQKGNSALRLYFNSLIRANAVFKRYETFELVKYVTKEVPNYSLLIAMWMAENRITLSEELADYVRQIDVSLACMMYVNIPVPDKLLECLIELKEFKKLIRYGEVFQFKINYLEILQQFKKNSRLDALKFAVAMAQHKRGPPVDLQQVCDALDISYSVDDWDFGKLIVQELERVKSSEQTES